MERKKKKKYYHCHFLLLLVLWFSRVPKSHQVQTSPCIPRHSCPPLVLQLILPLSKTRVQLSNYIAPVLRKSEKLFFACRIDFQRIPGPSLNLTPKGEQLPRAPGPRPGRSESEQLTACKAFLLFVCTLASCPDLFLSPFTRNPTN